MCVFFLIWVAWVLLNTCSLKNSCNQPLIDYGIHFDWNREYRHIATVLKFITLCDGKTEILTAKNSVLDWTENCSTLYEYNSVNCITVIFITTIKDLNQKRKKIYSTLFIYSILLSLCIFYQKRKRKWRNNLWTKANWEKLEFIQQVRNIHWDPSWQCTCYESHSNWYTSNTYVESWASCHKSHVALNMLSVTHSQFVQTIFR